MSINLNATVEKFLSDHKDETETHEIVGNASIEKGQFIAMTANTLSEDGKTRTLTTQVFDLEQAPGGDAEFKSGVYARGKDEKRVIVELVDGSGKQIATTETNYGI